MRTRGIIQALAAAVFFGASTPVAKVLLDSIQTFQLAGLLYLGAAICLAPVVLRRARRGETVLPRDRRNRWRLAGAVFFGGIVGPVLLLLGLRLALAASVAMWLNLEALATAVLAFVLFREHIGRWTWLGNVGVVIAGVMLSIDQGWHGWLGFAHIAGAAIAWGIDNNLTALIDGIRPTDSTFWKGLIAGSVNLAIGLAIVRPDLSVAWLWTLLLGGISYGASIVLYIHAAQNLGATRSQMIFAARSLRRSRRRRG
jgi:drug/metabolite transporter (DMT)-like permease